MRKQNRTLQERVSSLINTSVDDMQSGLWNYNDLNVLRPALIICIRRGEKTKVKILGAKIRKMEKNPLPASPIWGERQNGGGE